MDDNLNNSIDKEKEIEDTNQSPVGHISKKTKIVLQELFRRGLIEASKNINYYQTALEKRQVINQCLAPLDLQLQIDEMRGLAFLVTHRELELDQDDGNEWSHPLVRRNRFTLEQSMLVAILRQHYVVYEQEAGISSEVTVDTEEIASQLKLYLGDIGSDDANDKRLLKLLEHLKEHRIVSNINERERITIRPIITHLANPETLKNLLSYFKKAVKDGDTDKDKVGAKRG